MAHFIECSVPQITYLRGEKIINPAVNIDLCTAVKKSRLAWYPDNTGKPSLQLMGCNVEWVYDTEEQQNADFCRIANNCFK
jgi:hypothetical protein